MLCPAPDAKPLSKAKAKAPSEGKSSSSTPHPKKRNTSEAESSSQDRGKQAVEEIAASQPRDKGERKYGIKSVPPYAKEWYKKCQPDNYHPDLEVEEHRSNSKYPNIWQAIHDLGLSFVFRNSGDANFSLLKNFILDRTLRTKRN